MLPKEETKRFYELALSFVPDVGPKTARTLLAKFHSPEEIFRAPLKELILINGITEVRSRMFREASVLKQAEDELEFALKNNIEVLFLTNENYPRRFIHCDDAPVLLYYKGNANLNSEKIVAIIGTRKNTDYGQRLTEDLIEGLSGLEDTVVVSGLALGIDTIAHKSSLKNNIPTIGVVGHGLDTIYPHSNKALANEMLLHGGLLTEFPSGTKVERQNFPVRNRVVAGLSDVIIIVESEVKGGAMITAYVAHSYNRDVAAFPGRVYDSKSGGPNHLIKRNIAAMINGADDLLELMNWGKHENSKAKQKQLFVELKPEEKTIYDLLKEKDSLHADELMFQTGFTSPQLAATLLQMEMQGFIKTLPGKHYRIN
ncbi:MAG TPA: DNA-processing protein DprA [Flavipsychrobacter sp.]|nr:DNA-processing protein DprA [Flavipsychrobacter sp.]